MFQGKYKGAWGELRSQNKAENTAPSATEENQMIKQPVKLYVVRHGKTIFNALDRMQGVGNSPLLESGKE